MAAQISFQRYDLLTPPRWIGLDNYTFIFNERPRPQLFQSDRDFCHRSNHSAGAWCARAGMILYSLPRFRHVFEVTFYFPVIMTTVVAALIWLTLFYPRGLFDQLVSPWFPSGIPWLTRPVLVLPSVIVVDIWKSTGYYMIILLAGLLGIPSEYLEAASIDGAGTWARVRHILATVVRPQMMFVVIIALINSFQAFDSFYVLTRGGPGRCDAVIPIEIYLRAFNLLRWVVRRPVDGAVRRRWSSCP